MVLRVTLSEVVVQRCSVEKVFLTISQYSKEKNQFRSSFLIKLQAFRPFKKTFLKRNSKTGVFRNIVKFLRTLILKNICKRLPLHFTYICGSL